MTVVVDKADCVEVFPLIIAGLDPAIHPSSQKYSHD
jgi:hypothetical protein